MKQSQVASPKIMEHNVVQHSWKGYHQPVKGPSGKQVLECPVGVILAHAQDGSKKKARITGCAFSYTFQTNVCTYGRGEEYLLCGVGTLESGASQE